MTKIYLDLGHGGTDPGAIGNGLKEKDLTLKIGLKLKEFLKDYLVDVKCSRETDKTVSLKQRTNEANKWGADFLCSIHINAGGGEGYEDFIYNNLPKDSKTPGLRNDFHSEVVKLLDMKNRGKKNDNFHMLREANMSAILTENGFIDNVKDANKLKSDAYLSKVAQWHLNGLVKSLKLKKKNVTVPQPKFRIHIVKRNDTLYKIAEMYKFTIMDIMKINPGIKNPSKIYIGNQIKIPMK